MTDAIVVENLGKYFHRYHAGKPLTFMEAALSGFRRSRPVDEFWALRGVCFEVAAGEMLGVIGHNGAGKSTLLQILGKVTCPTEGHIKTQGHIGALLDLGAGFHGDLTGRENVFVTSIVGGLTHREVSRRFERIVEFAELDQFIDNPVRTYSSGMMMRLAFSVAVHTDPDILLVDEYLSVGDLAFQGKCLNRIAEMKEQGCAIVLVSHDVGQVERLCDRALWLKRGVVQAYGEPAVVGGQYTMHMRSQTQQRTPEYAPQLSIANSRLIVNKNRFGSLEAEIADVRLLPNSCIEAGSPLTVEIDYISHKAIDSAIFNLKLSLESGETCIDTNTHDSCSSLVRLPDRGTIRLVMNRVDLSSGQYFVSVGMFKHDWEYAYDYHWQSYPLTVKSSVPSQGILQPPLRWELLAAHQV